MRRSLCTALAGAALLAACLTPAGSRAAEGLQIEPGKWKIENKRTSRINGASAKPMNTTETKCVSPEEATWTPKEFMEGAPPECSFDDVVQDSNRLEWKMACDQSGGSMRGNAVYESTGKRVTGKMDMKVTGQMEMEITNEFVGVHQGPCD